MRIWVTPRALLLHLVVLVVVPGFLALAWWQLTRALSGNSLSWAYTFEWPFFAAYALFVWWKMVHDQPGGPEAQARADAQHAERPVGWALQRPEQRRRRQAAGPGTSAGPGTLAGSTTAGSAGTGSAGTGSEAADAAAIADTAGVVSGAEAFLGAEPAAVGDGDEVGEDAALAEYNRYLAALNASRRRKTW